MNLIDVIKNNPDNNYFVSASAGTGKTYTLTKYYISILEKNFGNPDIVERILAVTFTNKAAGEMRERILEAVYEKIDSNPPSNISKESWFSYWNEIKINLSRAWIKTIDSFCSRILKDNNLIVGIDPNFSMISEFKKEKEIQKAIQYSLRLIFELYEDGDISWLDNLSVERRNLIQKQVSILKGDMEKFKYSLNLFLTEKRLDDLIIYLKKVIQNFRLEMERVHLLENFELSDTDKTEDYKNILWVFKIMSIITSNFYESITIDNFQFDFKGILEKTISALNNEYVLNKYKNRFKYIIVDEFQDTNYLQKEIFERLHDDNNYLFYVGDRKQSIYRFRGADVSVFSKTQNEFEKLNYHIGYLNINRRSNSQIVEFANKISKQVLFKKENIEKDYVDIDLMENMIISENDICGFEEPSKEFLTPSLTESDFNRIKYIYGETEEKNNSDERMKKEVEIFAETINSLVGKDMTFRVRKDGSLTFETRPVNYGDFAILLKQMVGYENLIKESFSKFNIPYYIFGGKSFYYKPEIKAILSSLSAVQNPLNDFELTKYLMSLIVRMTFQEYHSLIEKRKGKESLFETLEKHKNLFNNNIVKGFDVLKKFKDLKYFLSPTNILKGIVNETDYLIYLSSLETTENAISNVKKMINEAEQYDNLANSFAELIKLLKNSTEVDEQEAVLEDEKSDSVKIMTIHKSKGLEFPIVILGGLHKAIKESRSDDIEFSLPDIDGNRYFLLKKIFEDSLKNTSDVFLDWFKNNDFLDFTENNRLIYVAVTRAKEMLIPVMVKNERSTSFNDFFKSVSYEKIDYIENSDIVSIKKDVIKENDDYGLVPEKNLTDFNHLAYKQYIAPTYLTDKFKFSEIRETEDLADFYNVNFYNSKNFLDNKNSFFDDQELLYKGSEIHLKLQSAINLSHIKNMVINKELPDGFDNLEIIKYAFDEKKKSKNEWRLMKKEVIDNKDFMLFGIVDKVVFDSNKITIIDFKYSNLTNKEKIEGYIFQIQFYMYLLKDFGDIDKGYIINVKTNEKPVIIEVAYNPDIKEIIYSKIKEL